MGHKPLPLQRDEAVGAGKAVGLGELRRLGELQDDRNAIEFFRQRRVECGHGFPPGIFFSDTAEAPGSLRRRRTAAKPKTFGA